MSTKGSFNQRVPLGGGGFLYRSYRGLGAWVLRVGMNLLLPNEGYLQQEFL